MLATVDRLLAPVTWLAALFAVVVLLVGPEVIGAKKPSRYVPGAPATTAPAPAAGQQVFASAGCGGCHTFKAAGSSGTVGPNLDDLKPDAATVEATVRDGAGTMPSFKGRLSDPQIKAVAQVVAAGAGG
jgi:mono/diheme cytochrome c family protein